MEIGSQGRPAIQQFVRHPRDSYCIRPYSLLHTQNTASLNECANHVINRLHHPTVLEVSSQDRANHRPYPVQAIPSPHQHRADL